MPPDQTRDLSWMLCIHNIPPKPPYLRAKAARRLAALGAVALKNAVYVLPDGEPQREGLLWLAREIEEGGGRAFVCGASFDVEAGGLTDAQVKALFVDARDAQYRELAAEAQPEFETLGDPREADAPRRDAVAAWAAQLRARFEAVAAVDFFGAPAREMVEGLLAGAERWLRLGASGTARTVQTETYLRAEDYKGLVWVTRPGVHVDRIASAWLVRRFIDAEAAFRFGPPSEGGAGVSDRFGKAGRAGSAGATGKAGAAGSGRCVRFDMAEAEFTHEGELCTFEVLLRRFGLDADPALAAVGAVIHDIDLDERHPARPESPGVGALIAGITLRTNDDDERLERGFRVLDDLLEYFRRSAPARPA
ncbi:chromate resistance protein ChrB domain-containing protein [Nitratidesulfovibrio liaohensis]|uniref:Chromate resistance protein n=1 Tax=Nitratidesulfovibrio liaohensis TaxID=2604158 RepID=A0ABY9R297_9BACT|nr:chromate resistance protein ChrB domain-containing protein [Nitratidesulfovibrio liaohensis]WMW65133.1 chromate resistance protein [Nitratidesulfovibrio liaohensis]